MRKFWQTSPSSMAAPLLREPRRHKFLALKMAKGSLDLIHPATSGYDLFLMVAIFSARSLTNHSASRPKTPSTETTGGVKGHHNIFSSLLWQLIESQQQPCVNMTERQCQRHVNRTTLPFEAANPSATKISWYTTCIISFLYYRFPYYLLAHN